MHDTAHATSRRKSKPRSVGEERLRKKLGAFDNLRWNIARLDAYSTALAGLPAEYAEWNTRESGDLVGHAIRQNHCLSWNDKSRTNLYYEHSANGPFVMEHVVPVSQWVAMYRAESDPATRDGIVFAGWCGPVARLTKETDRLFVNKGGEAKKNATPWLPFARYARASRDGSPIDIRHHAGADMASRSLADHYGELETFPFMAAIFDHARRHYAFDAVLGKLSGR
jgi:hypothetical protein